MAESEGHDRSRFDELTEAGRLAAISHLRIGKQRTKTRWANAPGQREAMHRDMTDPARHERVRAAMARKYWPFRIASWFGIGQRVTFAVDELERVDG